ncbi:MAG: DUF1508 domain-containing protein [Pseudoxanthomonas sp.]
MSGKFIISKRSNGDFQFNVKAGNNHVFLASKDYNDHASATSGVEIGTQKQFP